MKFRFRPYHLMLLLAAGAALGYARINKMDFYHRYFQVIADIEARNSQDLDQSTVAEWSSSFADNSGYTPVAQSLGVSIAQRFIPSFSFATEIAAPAALPKLISLIWGLYPTRAP
ncbi:MAG: hypothetical protein AB8F95_18915 [Bacteroidia bacterium]